MSWREKLENLRASMTADEKLTLVFDVAAGAPSGFLDDVIRVAPFVPASYIEFLRTTDGAQFDYFVFFGSGESQFPSLLEANAAWRAVIDSERHFVIGADPTGSAFVLRRDGVVILVPTDPPDVQYAQTVASSFDELLDVVLMGPRYVTLFPKGVRDENDWLDALQQRKWIALA